METGALTARPARWSDACLVRAYGVHQKSSYYRRIAILAGWSISQGRSPRSPLARIWSKDGRRGAGNDGLTPGDASGFTTHYDTQDVFILQIGGRKHWRISQPTIALPHRTQACSPIGFAPPPPDLELELEPGDLLYLPREIAFDSAVRVIGPNTSLKAPESGLYNVTNEENGLVVEFQGKKIALPGHVRPSLDDMRRRQSFRPIELAGRLDDEGKLGLARFLHAESFLTFAD